MLFISRHLLQSLPKDRLFLEDSRLVCPLSKAMLDLWLSQQPLIWMKPVQTRHTLPQLLKISLLHSWTPLVPRGKKRETLTSLDALH